MKQKNSKNDTFKNLQCFLCTQMVDFSQILLTHLSKSVLSISPRYSIHLTGLAYLDKIR